MRAVRIVASFLVMSLATVGAVLAGPTAHATPVGHDSVVQLVNTIGDRLIVAHEVAQSKWHSGSPINDPVRAATVIQAASDSAAAHGLDRAQVAAFFTDQVQAATGVQYAYFSTWTLSDQAQLSIPNPPLSDLRAKLDSISSRLLTDLAGVRSANTSPQLCQLSVVAASGPTAARVIADAGDPAMIPSIVTAMRVAVQHIC
ncbi:gamma subclass chorismate mutase AroQ [Williamsia muralis]|uniref:chorismate mutase n=1 Tax=Williamsia marianensis TaxID=85044 RepID=A0ABU4EW42_WILMA|nr:gamma subclass chorismate mutase AroQ [Williamsia muralis]MDV7134961.1 gamma subclass chorismate mutase AroQ [Williamsia muralis]